MSKENLIKEYLLEFRNLSRLPYVVKGATKENIKKIVNSANFKARLANATRQTFANSNKEKLKKWVNRVYPGARVPTSLSRNELQYLLEHTPANVNTRARLEKNLRSLYKTRNVQGNIPKSYINLIKKVGEIRAMPKVREEVVEVIPNTKTVKTGVYSAIGSSSVYPTSGPSVVVPKNVGNMTFANLVKAKAPSRPLNANVRARIAANLAANKKRRENAAIAAQRFNVGIVDIPERVLEDKQPRKEMVDLKDHQRAVAAAIMNQSGIIAVHSVGSGKTRTAIFAAETLLRAGTITHVIVVSPLTLLDTFKAEMRKHGLKSLNKYYYFGQEDFVKQIEHGAKLHIESALVIFDEIHTLKGTDTQKFKAFKEYTRRAKRVIGLTATPIVYSYTDLFGPLQLVTQKNIGHPSESEVKTKYSKYFSFFERISENNPDYPSYTIHEVDIEAKTAWILNEIGRNPNKRYIVYAHLIEKGLDVIGRVLTEAGIKYGKISGETPVSDRFKAQEKYNSGEVKVLLISKAAAYGIDLKRTRGLIVYERIDNPSALVQIVGRAVRFESHKGLPRAEQHVDVFLLEDPEDREYYARKVWLKMDEINRFYRSMWPGSIGVKLARRNYSRKQILINRINRGNNLINVMRNMNLPKNFVNRTNKLSNAHKLALRPIIRKQLTNNM